MDTAAKAVPQLAPNDLHALDYVSTRHDAKIPQGVTLEEILNPAFWAHHAMKLRPMDEIRVRAEDGTMVAYLLVLDASRTWARVKVDRVLHLGTADVAQTQAAVAELEQQVAKRKDEFKVTFRGPHRWSVVRKSDSNLMSEGHQEKAMAEGWVDQYVRSALSAPAPQPQPA